MKPKPILGLIGGIGAGKSTVAHALASFGGKVVSGDEAGHEALIQPAIQERVCQTFGNEILKENGSIDRRKLGQIVFADLYRKSALEAIVFPWIEAELRRKIAQLQDDADCHFVVLDAAVMLEAGWNRVCDKIVFVDAPLSVRIARVAQRGWTAEDLGAREAMQMPLEVKQKRADAIISNASDSQNVSHQIAKLLEKWNWIG